MREEEEMITNILKALANHNRIRILQSLCSSETCNCELGPVLKLEQSNPSRHIAILVRAGLVVARKEGVKTFYSGDDPTVYEIIDLARQVVVKQLEHQVSMVKG